MDQRLTLKQQKLIQLISENLGKLDETKTLGELMLEAGYSKSMSKSPQQALQSNGVRNALGDLIDELDSKARMALGTITFEKLEKASARDNAYIMDILTKNKQLLSGNQTSRQTINIEISEAIAGKNA